MRQEALIQAGLRRGFAVSIMHLEMATHSLAGKDLLYLLCWLLICAAARRNSTEVAKGLTST